jgi:orotidine-5'-phosphate decarboxylase
MLSQNQIPANERLIFALDVPSVDEAKSIVAQLGPDVVFYKCGLELFMADGYFELLGWLAAQGKKVFADLKFFDVPNTVGSAVRALQKHRPQFATVHGNDEILRAACREKGEMKILAVTVLTSLDSADLKALGFEVDPRQLVYSRAARALEIGCDGVISSGLEAQQLRSRLGGKFLVVVPGIRPVENRESDDQKRTVDVEEAFLNGADYIVVGRPIRQAPDPRVAAKQIQARIANLFPG